MSRALIVSEGCAPTAYGNDSLRSLPIRRRERERGGGGDVLL